MYIYVSAIRLFIKMYICIVAEFDGYQSNIHICLYSRTVSVYVYIVLYIYIYICIYIYIIYVYVLSKYTVCMGVFPPSSEK